jgi:hypothetical protein
MRMKQKAVEMLSVLFALLLVLAGGCSTTSAVQQTVSVLVASGFREVPANTPARLAQLKTLHHDKIARIQRGGKTYYVFPDTAHQKLYVGNADQYQSYVNALQDAKLASGISRTPFVVEDAVSTVMGADDEFGQ